MKDNVTVLMKGNIHFLYVNLTSSNAKLSQFDKCCKLEQGSLYFLHRSHHNGLEEEINGRMVNHCRMLTFSWDEMHINLPLTFSIHHIILFTLHKAVPLIIYSYSQYFTPFVYLLYLCDTDHIGPRSYPCKQILGQW